MSKNKNRANHVIISWEKEITAMST